MDSKTMERLQKALESRQNNSSGDVIVDVLTEARGLGVDKMSRAEIAYVLSIQEDRAGTLVRYAVRSGAVAFRGKMPVTNIINSVNQIPFYGLADNSCSETAAE